MVDLYSTAPPQTARTIPVIRYSTKPRITRPISSGTGRPKQARYAILRILMTALGVVGITVLRIQRVRNLGRKASATMRQEIEQNFSTLEAEKEKIYQTIADLPQETLSKKPSADQWCLTDLVNHLMLVERFALEQFQQTQHQKIKKTWMDRIKFLISKIALDTGKKITVPVADVDPLNVPAELPDIQQQWTDVRTAFKASLDRLSDEDLIYCYFSHPLAGNFTCQDGLVFLIKHWEHHQP